jgi:hypothetical protein
VILAGAITALAVMGFPQERSAFSSVELKFADGSVQQMQIVPASCASTPHPNEQCNSCTPGYYCVGNERYYRTRTCTSSFVERCPYGCRNGACLPPPECELGDPGCGSCTPQYFCFGADLYFRNSQCADSFIQACFYGCTAGSCNLAPAGTLNIQVSPALVRPNERTTVSWTSSGMASCTVTEDSPAFNDTWSGLTGTQQSSAITQRTTYTLTCRNEEGTVFTDTAVVNILPVFQET